MGKYRNELRWADVGTVIKKENDIDKSNYRPVDILPSYPRTYDHLIYSLINEITENDLTIFCCNFCNKYSSMYEQPW